MRWQKHLWEQAQSQRRHRGARDTCEADVYLTAQRKRHLSLSPERMKATPLEVETLDLHTWERSDWAA